jgi:phosphatidate cytidylyltransferase
LASDQQQQQQLKGQPPEQQADVSVAAMLEPQQEQQQQQEEASSPERKKPSGNFVKRVIAGVVLGLGGAAVVAVGNVPYLLVAMLVVYQATQEYYGFITSKGISAGMTPPPPFVSAMTTALCLSITVLTYVTRQVGI